MNNDPTYTVTFSNAAFNVAATGVNGFSRTLTLGGSNTGDNTISGAIIPNTGSSGWTSLVKSGSGTWILAGANTYTGATAVNGGTLALVGGSQASPITVHSGGKLGFTLGSPTTSTSTFDLSAGTIRISGTPTLDSYDLITSSAGITGTPTLDTPVPGYALQVAGNSLTLVKMANYDSWAATQSPPLTGGASAVGADGLSNLMIYAIDGLKTDHTNGAAGTLTGNLLTFTKRAEAISYGDVAWAIETSPDLVTWTIQVSQPKGDATPTISYSLPGGAGVLFARLMVSQ